MAELIERVQDVTDPTICYHKNCQLEYSYKIPSKKNTVTSITQIIHTFTLFLYLNIIYFSTSQTLKCYLSVAWNSHSKNTLTLLSTQLGKYFKYELK